MQARGRLNTWIYCLPDLAELLLLACVEGSPPGYSTSGSLHIWRIGPPFEPFIHCKMEPNKHCLRRGGLPGAWSFRVFYRRDITAGGFSEACTVVQDMMLPLAAVSKRE